MTRNVPLAARKGLTLSTSDEDYLVLLTITHPEISAIRVVNDVVDVTSNGQVFVGFPFEFVLPQEDDSMPSGKLRIQNIDRRIGLAVKGLKEPPYIRIDIALRSDPNNIFNSYRHLRLMNISADSVALEGTIGVSDFSSIPWPKTRATKRILPGLFKTFG